MRAAMKKAALRFDIKRLDALVGANVKSGRLSFANDLKVRAGPGSHSSRKSPTTGAHFWRTSTGLRELCLACRRSSAPTAVMASQPSVEALGASKQARPLRITRPSLQPNFNFRQRQA